MLEAAGLAPLGTYAVDVRDVVYRRDEAGTAWLARVYAPRDAGAGPFPALLDVHGGAWTSGDRTSNARIDAALAATGLVVVAVDFRVAPAHPYPAALQDVNYATRWLKTHAPDLNAVPGAAGVIGASSGGHLALLSAMCPHDPRYLGLGDVSPAGASGIGPADASAAFVIALWPPIDPDARRTFAERTGRQDLVTHTDGFFLTPQMRRDGSPQALLDRSAPVTLPPVLLIQGTADGNIPLPMISRFATSYRDAGGDLTLELFEGQPHGFASRPGPEGERALELIRRFVQARVPR